MGRRSDPAEQLHESWTANAQAWTEAVRNRQIESRRVATDAAILRTILERKPQQVLDVGCGEGWLCRALTRHGISAVGVDASVPLIESARGLGGGTFHVLSYTEMVAEAERLGEVYDAVVCNFSLLEEDVVPLLSALRRLAAPTGVLVIQTVHPWSACGEEPYQNGWRMESFASFGGKFSEPMPWYFRTLGSWIEVLHAAGWQVQEVSEPVHPDTGRPLSLLLICAQA